MGNRNSSVLPTDGKDLRHFRIFVTCHLLDSPISSSANTKSSVCSRMHSLLSCRQKIQSILLFRPREYLSWQGKSSFTHWTHRPMQFFSECRLRRKRQRHLVHCHTLCGSEDFGSRQGFPEGRQVEQGPVERVRSQGLPDASHSWHFP